MAGSFAVGASLIADASSLIFVWDESIALASSALLILRWHVREVDAAVLAAEVLAVAKSAHVGAWTVTHRAVAFEREVGHLEPRALAMALRSWCTTSR